MGGIPIPSVLGMLILKAPPPGKCLYGRGNQRSLLFPGIKKRDDGLYAAALFLYYLSRTPYPLSQIRKLFLPLISLPTFGLLLKERRPAPSRGKFTFRRRSVLSRWNKSRGEEGWAMICKSVTEPVYTLRLREKPPQDIPRLVHRFLRSLPEVEKEVLRHIKKQERN